MTLPVICQCTDLFICRKDSLLCLAVDYQGLKSITKKDQYPVPLIPDLLDCLHSANIYSKTNLCGAYTLVCIANGDEWKTTLHTRYGSYEFQVMRYRLTNTPAMFQHFMNKVFKDLLDVCVVIYLDDILIYSENPDKHVKQVNKVFIWTNQKSRLSRIGQCLDTSSMFSLS